MKHVLEILNAMLAAQEQIMQIADEDKDTCNVKVKGYGAFELDFSNPSCDVIAKALNIMGIEYKERDAEFDQYCDLLDELHNGEAYPVAGGEDAFDKYNDSPTDMWGSGDYGQARWMFLSDMCDAVEERIKESNTAN